MFELFPRLKERIKQGGWSLSGGEQQMLAIGRALMSRPSLLMLDEPSLGLAPIVIEQVFDKIVELNKRTGLGVLLVEQNSAMALEIASRAFVLETGTITLSGPAAVLAGDPRIREAYPGADCPCVVPAKAGTQTPWPLREQEVAATRQKGDARDFGSRLGGRDDVWLGLGCYPAAFISFRLFASNFRERRRRHRQAAAAQLAQHEFGGRHVPGIDRPADQAHAEIAGRRADLDLERDHVAAKHQAAQHLERIGFGQHVETQFAPRGDLVENLPAAERTVRQRRRDIRRIPTAAPISSPPSG